MLPPLNVTRLLWSFRDQKYGWTESWCVNGLLQTQAIIDTLNNYLSARMPLMGLGIWADYASGRYLNGTSFSYKLNPNQIASATGNQPTNSSGNALIGFTGVLAYDPTPPDRPYSSLMMSCFGAAGQSKKIFLSGCPDDVIVDPFGPVFNANYRQAFLAYRARILQSSLGWIGTQGNGQPRVPIASVSVGPPGTVTVTGGGFAVGNVVQVGGFRGLTGYRGRFLVAAVAGNTVTLQGYDPPASLNRVSGYLQLVSYAFIAASSFQGPSENKRSRGKGIALPVGRRKARRS